MLIRSAAFILLLSLSSSPAELPLIHFSKLRRSPASFHPSDRDRRDALELLRFKEHRKHDASIAGVGERCRVAVLSFYNSTGEEERDWLSWELADSVIRKLGTARDMEFFELKAMRPYERRLSRGKRGETSRRDVESLAFRSGADIVIVGRFSSEGKDLRVELQAMRPSREAISGISRFRGPAGRIWELESELALGVAELLGVKMSDNERERLKNSPTASAVAFEEFSRGRQASDGSSSKVQHLQKALEADPRLARAHYLLGNAYCGIGMTYQYVEWFNKALAEYRRAVALDPEFAEAYCAMGIVYMINGRYDLTRKALERAVYLNPGMKLACGYLQRLEGMGF